MPKFAFSSNAFKATDLFDAARQIADAGFAGLEVMADVPHAEPSRFGAEPRRRLLSLLRQRKLQVSNVNAFTLFARGDTYHPTWIESDPGLRQVRIDHTRGALQLAADLEAHTVSTQPGGPTIGTRLTRQQALERFASGLEAVVPIARKLGVTLAIEPEPGLLIQDSAEYLAFKQDYFAQEPYVALNCDMGHFYCVGENPAGVVRTIGEHIAHVHLEDIAKNRVHQHLALGRGDMDIVGILQSLSAVNYAGWVTVELYPYVNTAGEMARLAMEYLKSTTVCQIG